MTLEQERPIGGLIGYIDNSARMLSIFNPAGAAFAGEVPAEPRFTSPLPCL